jgi:hypothetical protein
MNACPGVCNSSGGGREGGSPIVAVLSKTKGPPEGGLDALGDFGREGEKKRRGRKTKGRKERGGKKKKGERGNR